MSWCIDVDRLDMPPFYYRSSLVVNTDTQWRHAESSLEAKIAGVNKNIRL